jgi:hypothetical protein
VIVCTGDVKAAQNHLEPSTEITQTNSGVISLEPGAKGAPSERRRHEEWEQRAEEDWQSHFERLQQCVCDLLLNNQQLKMALMTADERDRVYREAVNR